MFSIEGWNHRIGNGLINIKPLQTSGRVPKCPNKLIHDVLYASFI